MTVIKEESGYSANGQIGQDFIGTQAESLPHQRKGWTKQPKHPERVQPAFFPLFQPFRLMREVGDALNERALPFLEM